jgi:hypothetical protein
VWFKFSFTIYDILALAIFSYKVSSM